MSPEDKYAHLSINLEMSPFLNLTAEDHKIIRPSAHQSIEGLAYLLGYQGAEVRSHLVELSRHMAQAWYKAHAEMPLHQLWSFWAEDDDFTHELEAAELSLDTAHPMGDRLVAVYPQTPLTRNAVERFFAGKGLKTTGDRTWKDFYGFQRI